MSEIMSFPSYSCPVDCISTHYDNDLLETNIKPLQVQKSGSYLSSTKSTSRSMTIDDSELCVDSSCSPYDIPLSLPAHMGSIPLHYNSDPVHSDYIAFPLRDFEDFYLNNLPSAKFHTDYGDVFDFRSLVTDTETMLTRFCQKGLPSKIVGVIAAYRDTVPVNDDDTVDVPEDVVDEIELSLDVSDIHPISKKSKTSYAAKAATKSMKEAAANTVKVVKLTEVRKSTTPEPVPLYKSSSYASYFVAHPHAHHTPHINIAHPSAAVPSPQATKISRFAAMSIRSILSLNLDLIELIELKVVIRLMTDQYGSRYLQNVIRSFNKETCLEMITMLLHHMMDINADLIGMCEDIYGNYLIQLFFDRGSEAHHKILLNNVVYPSILRLCRSKYGCRVVQKVLGSVKNCDKVIACFKQQTENEPRRSNNSLHHCLICSNTNHVVQKMIELKQPYKTMEFIKKALEKDLVAYSENVFACRVVQAFVTVYGDKLNVHKLFENGAHLFLSRVKYGNYVIQCIVKQEQWYSSLPSIVKFRNKLISDVFTERNILFLSKDKHASNVIETCIKVATAKQLQPLIHMVCSKQGFLLRNLMSDRYGNYVPRTLLQYCSRRQKRMLVNTVHLYITNLHHYDYDYKYHQSVKFMAEVKYAMDNTD